MFPLILSNAPPPNGLKRVAAGGANVIRTGIPDWSVVQTGFVPAATASFLVTSPTTLTSRFAPPAWIPGGYEIG